MQIKVELLKAETKEMLIFLAVTYGMPLLMTVPLALTYEMGKDTYIYATVQMFYPASGLMLAKLICDKDKNMMPKKFFIGFLVLASVMALWCLTPFFLSDKIVSGIHAGLSFVSSLAILSIFLSEDKEKRNIYGLTSKNWNLSARLLILFVILTFARSLLFSIADGSLTELADSFSPSRLKYGLMVLPFSLFSSFCVCLGEEYGWRCYFQPLLQKKFGLIKGVLVFGVLWELWHLPLVLFYFAPAASAAQSTETLVQYIIFRLISVISIGIFMAYAYMKTHNVWLAVLIHFSNNYLLMAGVGTGGGTIYHSITWTQFGIYFLSQVFLFLPFFHSEVFKKQTATYLK